MDSDSTCRVIDVGLNWWEFDTPYGKLSISYNFIFMAFLDDKPLSYWGVVDGKDVWMMNTEMARDIKQMVTGLKSNDEQSDMSIDKFVKKHEKILSLAMVEDMHDQ